MKSRALLCFLAFWSLRSIWSEPMFKENFSSGKCLGNLQRLEILQGKVSLQQANLLKNGSFEDSDKTPVGFYLYDSRGGQLVTDIAYHGKNSVFLSQPTSLYVHPTNFAAVRKEVEWYVVSAWVKTDFPAEKPEEILTQLRVWGNNQEKKHTQVVAASIAGNHDWVRLVQPIKVKPETAFIHCDIKFILPEKQESQGRLWIDGVQIEEGKRPTEFTEKYYRQGIYTSPVITLTRPKGKITWEGETPEHTGVEVRWRAGKQEVDLKESEWTRWNPAKTVSFSASGEQYFQVQVRLVSRDRGLVSPGLVCLIVE
ncbi:MAG: hypothetical protein NC911_08460 [Candidatus Omnitrophica bacterium]|nr:hypothetical protein [Candidatus Omnitrophota bacterium]